MIFIILHYILANSKLNGLISEKRRLLWKFVLKKETFSKYFQSGSTDSKLLQKNMN